MQDDESRIKDQMRRCLEKMLSRVTKMKAEGRWEEALFTEWFVGIQRKLLQEDL